MLCGAENPESLRGTKLRKHIATTCIKLNLEDQEVNHLANFMGHNEKIHRDIYRQPLVSREILRMSQLLEVAQGGRIDEEVNSEDSEDETRPNSVNKTTPKKYSKTPKREKRSSESIFTRMCICS